MKTLVPVIVAILFTVWIGIIGILSAQNLTLISLQFLLLKSVSVPLGIALCFCVILGMLSAALFLLILQYASRRRSVP